MSTQEDDRAANAGSENYAAAHDPGDVVDADDDTFDDVEWDELLAAAEADFAAGRFRFISTSEDPQEAKAALKRHLDEILREVLSKATPD
jgi:hypothetical protein